MTALDFETASSRLDSLVQWWDAEGDQNRNEATTRLHLIDSLLYGALSWPKALVTAEDRYEGKYADYSVGRPATRLIVEAKREGVSLSCRSGSDPVL